LYVAGTTSRPGGSGDLNVGNGGSVNVSDTVTIWDGGSVTNQAGGAITADTLAINGGSYSGQDLSGFGAAWFASGSLNITGDRGLTIGSEELLSVLALMPEDTLDVLHSLTITDGGTIWVNGGTFTAEVLHLSGGSYTADDLSGIAALQFTAGTLAVTGSSGLAIGINELIGDSVTLDSAKTLNVTDAITINDGASLALAGGSLTAGNISNEGTFVYNSGMLHVAGTSGLQIGADGLFTAMTLAPEDAMVVADATTIGANGTLSIAGGTFTTDSISNSGSFAFISGTLAITGSSGLSIGSDGLLATTTLYPGDTLDITDAIRIANDGTATMSGGTIITDRIENNGVFRFLSGSLELTGSSGLVIGNDGLFAAKTLSAADALHVAAATTLELGGSLTVDGGVFQTSVLELDGGSYTAADLRGIASLQLASGSLRFNGESGISIGHMSAITDVSLFDGDLLDVAGAVVIEEGGAVYSDIYFSPPTTIRIPRRGRWVSRGNLVGCWRRCLDLLGSQRGLGALGFLRG
jgi:hypothetical protein